jgi:hypothetical protein
MGLEVDLRQPSEDIDRSFQPSHLRPLGLAVDDDRSLIGPARPQYSYWAECECPHDCLRDHENE